MHKLDFRITLNGHRYRVFIERDVVHYFRSKREAHNYIRKYRDVLTDNLPIILNLHQQLKALRNQHYQFMDTGVQRLLKNSFMEFEDDFAMIFYNLGGENETYVQFNKIRIVFDHLSDIIQYLKQYGQKGKRVVMLNQLNGISKIFVLCERNYSNEVRGLFVAHGYRGGLRNLKPSENEKHLPNKAS